MKMSDIYTPMLASPAPKNFLDTYKGEWITEGKLDGIRAIAYFCNGKVRFINRSMNDVTGTFPEVRPVIDVDCVLDGELVCLDQTGFPNFQLMQTRMNRYENVDLHSKKTPAIFQAFDILEVKGEWLGSVPLIDRKFQLQLAAPELAVPYTINNFEEEIARNAKAEGVMAKRANSPYIQGYRSKDWLKIKNRQFSKNTYIVGCTVGTGRRSHVFGALIVAEKVDTEYKLRGEVGTGFNDETVDALYSLMKQHTTKDPIFLGAWKVNGPQFFTEPIPVTVSFQDTTSHGIYKLPVYVSCEAL